LTRTETKPLESEPTPIRVALLLGGHQTPAWVVRAVAQAAALPGVRFRSLFVSPSGRRPRLDPLELYRRLDRRAFLALNRVPEAMRPADLQEALPPNLPPSHLAGPLSPAELRKIIDEKQIDLVMNFGEPVPESLLQQAPPLGIWELRFGQGSDASGMQEMMENRAGVDIRLVARGAGANTGRTLAHTVAAVDRSSFFRTQNRLLWQSVPLFHRGLALVSSHGLPKPAPDPARRPVSRGRMARLVPRVFRRLLEESYREILFHKNWFMLVRKTDTPLHRQNWRLDPREWRRIEAPPDRFYADPFLFSFQGRPYLFFEDFRWKTGRGHISAAALDAGGRPGAIRPALVRPYHLSYPFIFTWQGDVYLLPETRQNRIVELYRAVRFPDRWQRVQVLFENTPALDPTLLEHDGRWWLFMNIARTGLDGHEELFLFHAASPLGPWQAHPRNPIVSDVRRARPAGRVFIADDRLYRPGQDCSIRYGGALRIQEITTLSETDYEEREVGLVSPKHLGRSLGVHTYNAEPPFEVLDGYAYAPRFWPGGRRP